MTNDQPLRSRRQVLASAGRLSIGSVIAPALASAALGAPAAAAPAPYANLAADETEVTAEQVVDALEGAYGVQRM